MPRRVRVTDLPTESSTETTEETPQPEAKAPTWPVLTDEEKQAIRDKNPGISAFIFRNSGQTYVCKPLSSREWHALTQQVLLEGRKGEVEPARQDEIIADAAIIWPVIHPTGRAEFWKQNLAGAARSLVLQIRQKSGFSTVTDEGLIVADALSVKPLFPEETEEAEVLEPDDEALESFRQTSPNQQVFRAELPGQKGVHYFKPWSRSEWEALQTQEERGSDFRDFGVRAALLWSSLDWKKPVLAGLIEQLFNELLVCSGFTTTPVVEEL